MKALLLAAFCALLVTPATANDIRVYSGTRSRQHFTPSAYALEKFPTYLVIDHTDRQFAFITYYKNRTYSAAIYTLDIDTIQPNSPQLTANSREFLYVQTEGSGVPVDVMRFRGTAKPRLIATSSTTAHATSATLAYTGYYYALAAFNYEETATFSLQKALTISINNTNTNLSGAIALAVDDLRRRKKVD